MTVDVVCYYADLGRPYGPLIERMVTSAKRAMPDCRTVLLTPKAPDEIAEMFDCSVAMSNAATPKNLCVERVRAMVSWQAVAGNRTVYVDPDIEFKSPPPFDGTFDAGLLWRAKPDQPVNTGAILAEPGHVAFWKHYATIAVNLPKPVHGWFADQLAFALLTGVCHVPDERLTVDDARVWLMDAPQHCFTPDEVTPEAWAVHYKGAMKGPGWDKIFTNYKEVTRVD